MPEREPLPSWADWQGRADALGLRLRSGELVGPCPSCGGTDRFHIRRRDPDAIVGCRGCIDGIDGGSGFGAVLRAVFPERPSRTARDTIGSPSISRTPRTPKSPQPADTGPDPRAELVARLWARAAPADPTPGRLYLALRFAWPAAGIGPELPATVRWLARGGEPRSYWPGVSDAAGALAFAWRRPDGELATLTLMAISAAGERVLWKREDTEGPGNTKSWVIPRTSRAGTAFETRAPSCDADPVHVAEGEADALALALAPWCGPGGVYAAGGTSGLHGVARGNLKLPGRGPVVIHADEGGQGCKAAGEAQARIQAAGRECRVEWYAGDPADALAEWIGARAAIREYEGGEAREAADRGAWHDLLSEVSPDGP